MPRLVSAPGRERDYDYSNVGKVGRRTGVTLEPRPLDEHGMEEMTGLFSSPRKPSPVNKRTVIPSVELPESATTPRVAVSSQAQTPATTTSARRSVRGQSHPPPRSSSPKKSGITGTARRSGALDLLANKQLQQDLQEDIIEQGSSTQLSATPQQHTSLRAASARPATVARRFSPERTPLRNRVLNQRAAKSAVVGRVSDAQSLLPENAQSDPAEETPSRVYSETVEQDNTAGDVGHSTIVNMMGYDDESNASLLPKRSRQPLESEIEYEEDLLPKRAHQPLQSELEPEMEPEPEPESELPDPPVANDYSDDDQTFEPPPKQASQRSVPNKANSRRKRKSDAMEDAESVASPVAKRAKRKSNEKQDATLPKAAVKGTKSSQSTSKVQDEPAPSKPTRGRKALAKKDTNKKLSPQRQEELDKVVEKIRARPAAPKSLYILRRETPADDTVTHTRSGRISIKPLAYWRNEHCVFDEEPEVEEGTRFPLNKIKEVVRNEDAPEVSRSKNKKSTKSKGKGKGKRRAQADEDTDSDLDLASDNETRDPDADEWELESGTLKGSVASWDVEHQTGAPEEPIIVELAHAHAAIQTKDVKGSTFKYAKLLSSPFFGAGVVDLPGGSVKRAKNSRKMHMCFFVVQGRVTVRVGAIEGQDGEDEDWGTRFSIGKGGFWQVPRGNQYSIENEHGKTARIFFSQGCESAPDGSA